MCTFIEMDDKEIIKFLRDPQSVPVGSLTEKCIIKTLLDTILKKEDFVNLLIRWKVESMQTLIRIMKEICTNEIPSEAIKDFFLENVVSPMMTLEIEAEMRDNLIEVASTLCPLVPVTNLSQNEYQIFLQVIYSKYIPAISQLRDSNYSKWHKLWIFLIRFCGKKIHESMDLTNRLLRIVEYAFRNTSCEQRLKGYDCWKELIDNASLDPKHIGTLKQIKLLITPLRAKFAKQEVVICKRFDLFVYLLEKLQQNAVLCLPEFLEFCFGLVGDSKDNSRSGQAKSVPQIWSKSAKVLIGILGHGHDQGVECVFEEIYFDKPLVNGSNIKKFYKILLNSMAECCTLLKDDNMENKRKKVIKCMWKSLFNLIMCAPESERDEYFLLVADVLDRYLQQSKEHPYFEDLLKLIFLSLISLENDDLDNRIPIMLKQLITIFITIDVGPNDIFKQIVTQSFSKVLLEENKLKMMHTIMDCLSIENIEDKNIMNYAKTWLLMANELTTDCDPAKFNEFSKFDEFFSWPCHNLNRLEDTSKKQIVLYWMKLYRKVTIDNESKKMNIMKDLEKSFNNNPLLAPNIASLLNVISQFETKFSLEFVIKLMEVVSLILQLPNLQTEDENKLSSLVMQYFEPSLTCYKSEDVEELVKIISTCIERILSLHSGFKLIDPLVAFIKMCPEKLNAVFAKHLKDLSSELYQKETDNNNVNKAKEFFKIVSVFTKSVEEEKKTFVIPSGRSARIAIMGKNSPTSPHKPTKLKTTLQLFGTDPEDMSPLKIKGSQLNNTPISRKKKGANVVEVKTRPAKSVNEENSMDFVSIDTEVKLRPDKLSEHQKEILKKRREDIPALYQDLSQSISQDMFSSKSNSKEPVALNNVPTTTSDADLFSQMSKDMQEVDKAVPETNTNGDKKADDSKSSSLFSNLENRIDAPTSSDVFNSLPFSRHSLPAIEEFTSKSSQSRKSFGSITLDDENPVEKRKRREIERLKMDIVGADMFYESPRRTRVKKPTKKEEEALKKTQADKNDEEKTQNEPLTDSQPLAVAEIQKPVPNSPKKSVGRPSKAKIASKKEEEEALKKTQTDNKNDEEITQNEPLVDSQPLAVAEIQKPVPNSPKKPVGRPSKAKIAENQDAVKDLFKKINKTPKTPKTPIEPPQVHVGKPNKAKKTEKQDELNDSAKIPSESRVGRPSKAKKTEIQDALKELAKEMNKTVKTPKEPSEVPVARTPKTKKTDNQDSSKDLTKETNKTPKIATERRVGRPKKKKSDTPNEDKVNKQTEVTEKQSAVTEKQNEVTDKQTEAAEIEDHPNLTPESPSRKRRRSKSNKRTAIEEDQNTVIEIKPKSPEKDKKQKKTVPDDQTPNNEIKIQETDKKPINNINIKIKFDNKTRSAKIIDQLDDSIINKKKIKRRKTQVEDEIEKTMETEAPKELPLETPKHLNVGIVQKNLQTLLDEDSTVLQTQDTTEIKGEKRKKPEEESEDIIESSQESFVEIIPLLNSSKKRSSRIEETLKEELDATKLEDDTALIRDYLVQMSDKIELINEEIELEKKLDVCHSQDSTLTQDISAETLSAMDTFTPPLNVDIKSPDPPKRPQLTDSELIMCQKDTMSICLPKDSIESDENGFEKESEPVVTLNSVEDILATTTSTDTAPSTSPCTPLRSPSLPSSPVTADTPNRTSELLDNTIDISPISSGSESEDEAVVPMVKPIQIDFGELETVVAESSEEKCVQIDFEQLAQMGVVEPMDEIQELVAKVNEFVNDDDDKDDSFEDGCVSGEAEGVTVESSGDFHFDFPEPACHNDENLIQNGHLALSFNTSTFRGFKESGTIQERSSKLKNLIQSMSNKPFIKRKTGTTSSPSAMRIKKLFVNLGAKQLEHQHVMENFNENDILTFSREIPSPLAVPVSSILKRKYSDSSDGEGISPCAKRKRVNFSDPCLTSKKIFIKDDYQPSLEAKRLFDSTTEKKSTDDHLKDIFDYPDEPPSSELSTETDSEMPETEPSLTVVNPMILHKNKPIFPKLVDCKDDVLVIVKRITSPMFVPALMNKLKGKNIKTIGELAKLSEAEVNRFPFKVPVVTNVLAALENYHRKRGGGDSSKLDLDHCRDDDKRNGDVEMPKLDVKLELKMLMKRALREKVPTDDLAKILLPHVDNTKLYPLIKSQCPSVALDTLEEKDYTSVLKIIIDSKGISEILKRAHVNFHKAEKEHDFYQAIADYVKYTVPLEKFFKGRSIEDLEVGIEESIKNKVFQKGEIIENCLLPLIETPEDISPYLNTLNTIDLGKIVLRKAKQEDPQVFFQRIIQSYSSNEAKTISESLWCQQTTAPLELVSCFGKKLDQQSEQDRTESMVEMFKFISEKLDRKTLLDLHIVFLSRISGAMDK